MITAIGVCRHVGCDFVAQAHSYATRLEDWKKQDALKHMAHQVGVLL